MKRISMGRETIIKNTLNEGLNLIKQGSIVKDTGENCIINEKRFLALFGQLLTGAGLDWELGDTGNAVYSKLYYIDIFVSGIHEPEWIAETMFNINTTMENGENEKLHIIDSSYENTSDNSDLAESEEPEYSYTWYFTFDKPIIFSETIQEGLNLQKAPKKESYSYAEIDKILREVAAHIENTGPYEVMDGLENGLNNEWVYSVINDFIHTPERTQDVFFEWNKLEDFIKVTHRNCSAQTEEHIDNGSDYYPLPPNRKNLVELLTRQMIEVLKRQQTGEEFTLQFESISNYKKPLTTYIFHNTTKLRKKLVEDFKFSKEMVTGIFKSPANIIAERLLTILEVNDIKTILSDSPELLKEASFKCSIEDVEKKAKKIIFVKYNWDPKNVVFTQENESVQIMVMSDLKPELQSAEEPVVLKFLENLARAYTKDLNSEYSSFCGRIKFLSHLATEVTSSVYCYTVVQRGLDTILYNSNGDARKLKHGNHPQYQLNKLYFKIGLFASNVLEEMKIN
jgi:hypothetical protein